MSKFRQLFRECLLLQMFHRRIFREQIFDKSLNPFDCVRRIADAPDFRDNRRTDDRRVRIFPGFRNLRRVRNSKTDGNRQIGKFSQSFNQNFSASELVSFLAPVTPARETA